VVINIRTRKYSPDGHQHQLPAYQLEIVEDLHPANFTVTMQDSKNFFSSKFGKITTHLSLNQINATSICLIQLCRICPPSDLSSPFAAVSQHLFPIKQGNKDQDRSTIFFSILF
jgi:hypothetical protein